MTTKTDDHSLIGHCRLAVTKLSSELPPRAKTHAYGAGAGSMALSYSYVPDTYGCALALLVDS